MKHALIFDLDNTIYPVGSIADHLFEHFYTLLQQNPQGINYAPLKLAKHALTQMPYHTVADKFNFSAELKNKGIGLLKNITYNLPIQPFAAYLHVKQIPVKKFLVTAGFTNLQRSKIKMLGIENDFAEIHIVDPEVSQQTKKDVFAHIMLKHNYPAAGLLVIGDDPASEIKAATELGIETFLLDPENKYPNAVCTYKAEKLNALIALITL